MYAYASTLFPSTNRVHLSAIYAWPACVCVVLITFARIKRAQRSIHASVQINAITCARISSEFDTFESPASVSIDYAELTQTHDRPGKKCGEKNTRTHMQQQKHS